MRNILLLVFCFGISISFAQEEAISKRPVISLGCQNRYIIAPYNISIGLSNNNLKNQIRIAYNLIIIPRGLQLGYQRNFFKRNGIQIGVNYIHFLGKFNYVNPDSKIYEYATNLNMFKAEVGYYFRFKMHDFGIFEPSFSISYQKPINSNSKLIFDQYYLFKEVFFNVNLRYYFKRNKPKQ